MAAQEHINEYRTDAVLKDGSRILLRPITKQDAEKWLNFISRLDSYTKYLRFHHVPKMTIDDAAKYCTVDYHNSFALVAEAMRKGSKDIVAVGRYFRLPNKECAEVGFLVEEAYQNKGIGTKRLEHLVAVAHEKGIHPWGLINQINFFFSTYFFSKSLSFIVRAMMPVIKPKRLPTPTQLRSR